MCTSREAPEFDSWHEKDAIDKKIRKESFELKDQVLRSLGTLDSHILDRTIESMPKRVEAMKMRSLSASLSLAFFILKDTTCLSVSLKLTIEAILTYNLVKLRTI